MTTPHSVAVVRNRPFPMPTLNSISGSPQHSAPSDVHSQTLHPAVVPIIDTRSHASPPGFNRALPRKSPPRIRAPNLSSPGFVSSNSEGVGNTNPWLLSERRDVYRSLSAVPAGSPSPPTTQGVVSSLREGPPAGAPAPPPSRGWGTTAERGGPNPIRRVMTPPKIMTPPRVAIYSSAQSLNESDGDTPPPSTSSNGILESPPLSAWGTDLEASPNPTSLPFDHSLMHRMRGLHKWEAFSLLYPDNTIPFTIRVNEQGDRPQSYVEENDTGSGSWYSTNENHGARVLIEPNEPDKFIEIIAQRIKSQHGVSIYTTYNRQINVIWITADKEIYRYEPQVPGGDYEQRSIDGGLCGMFSSFLPGYTYMPHRLEAWQCPYNPDDTTGLQCEDYTVLYVIRRIKGLDHHQAVTDLVVKGDELVAENAWLSQKLNHKILSSVKSMQL